MHHQFFRKGGKALGAQKMAITTLSVLTKVGIIADEMTPPRGLAGIVRPVFSVVAVAYA